MQFWPRTRPQDWPRSRAEAVTETLRLARRRGCRSAYRQPVSRSPGARPADWLPRLSRSRRPISSATPSERVDEQQISRVRALLGRMVDREPLSRILGSREFWGLEFALSADTLDPRPETETVVEAVLRRKPDRQRAPSLSRSRHRYRLPPARASRRIPGSERVGIDIAEGAVRTAARNAASLGLADRARFLVGDWAAAVSGRFDAIVANPPYIASGALALLAPRGRLSRPMAGSRWRRGRSAVATGR